MQVLARLPRTRLFLQVDTGDASSQDAPLATHDAASAADSDAVDDGAGSGRQAGGAASSSTSSSPDRSVSPSRALEGGGGTDEGEDVTQHLVVCFVVKILAPPAPFEAEHRIDNVHIEMPVLALRRLLAAKMEVDIGRLRIGNNGIWWEDATVDGHFLRHVGSYERSFTGNTSGGEPVTVSALSGPYHALHHTHRSSPLLISMLCPCSAVSDPRRGEWPDRFFPA